ncbi:hypothetical protein CAUPRSCDRAFT_11670 [Caulochytrium protostelioides]|uniref:Uncharacterized protein n=1 Tax=Caulochytrium protostelioides TaxID=1555241 RepID=A0A4P9WTL8_9FUNG|nr:hypothetical protein CAUPRSCDRAFT_11670 [Caulochytrium protostelioides]
MARFPLPGAAFLARLLFVLLALSTASAVAVPRARPAPAPVPTPQTGSLTTDRAEAAGSAASMGPPQSRAVFHPRPVGGPRVDPRPQPDPKWSDLELPRTRLGVPQSHFLVTPRDAQ